MLFSALLRQLKQPKLRWPVGCDTARVQTRVVRPKVPELLASVFPISLVLFLLSTSIGYLTVYGHQTYIHPFLRLSTDMSQ